jgi:hypothetical protein
MTRLFAFDRILFGLAFVTQQLECSLGDHLFFIGPDTRTVAGRAAMETTGALTAFLSSYNYIRVGFNFQKQRG